jgi:hypothetical protein
MTEKFYQHILIANLYACGYKNIIYEDVFTYNFTDMHGNPVRVGHGMNARTDVELLDLNVILELKSSSGPTKQENFAQCRNYLIHRPDVQVGIVINFISKETNDSSPYTQIDVMMKTGNMITVKPGHDLPEFYEFATKYTELQPYISSYVKKENSVPTSPPTHEGIQAKENVKMAKKKAQEDAKAAKKKEQEDAKAAKKKAQEEAKAAKKKNVEENKSKPLIVTSIDTPEFVEKYDELDDNLYYVEGGYSSVYSGLLYKTLEGYENECKERKYFSQIKGYK